MENIVADIAEIEENPHAEGNQSGLVDFYAEHITYPSQQSGQSQIHKKAAEENAHTELVLKTSLGRAQYRVKSCQERNRYILRRDYRNLVRDNKTYQYTQYEAQ